LQIVASLGGRHPTFYNVPQSSIGGRAAVVRETREHDPSEILFMIAIRNACWAVLVLAALAGCNKPEEANQNVTKPPVAPGSAPESPPPAPATKAEMKPEGAPAPAAKEEVPKESGEAPRVEAPVIEAPKVEPPKDEKKADNEAAAVRFSAEELAEIKKLPASDQDRALKQLVCPVSGESLGSMGVPFKVSAEGKTFFLCCKGCNKEVKADPKAVVAKLNQK